MKLDHVDDVPAVYIVRIGGGLVKIGYSGYFAHRVEKLGKGNGQQLEPVALFPGSQHLEKKLHALFDEYRVGTEKFDEEPILSWLRDSMTSAAWYHDALKELGPSVSRKNNMKSKRARALDIILKEVKKNKNRGMRDRELSEIITTRTKEFIDVSTFTSRACKKRIAEWGLIRDNSVSPVVWRLLDGQT